jgi:hypothetical protein
MDDLSSLCVDDFLSPAAANRTWPAMRHPSRTTEPLATTDRIRRNIPAELKIEASQTVTAQEHLERHGEDHG